ncbi:MAG: hypothetical protein ACP5G1_03240 [Nanopusillaceae archaeon]
MVSGLDYKIGEIQIRIDTGTKEYKYKAIVSKNNVKIEVYKLEAFQVLMNNNNMDNILRGLSQIFRISSPEEITIEIFGYIPKGSEIIKKGYIDLPMGKYLITSYLFYDGITTIKLRREKEYPNYDGGYSSFPESYYYMD